jgi:CBS domain-containing protein
LLIAFSATVFPLRLRRLVGTIECEHARSELWMPRESRTENDQSINPQTARVCAVKIKERWEFAHKPAVYSLRGDEKVSTAIKVLAERNIGSVVVVDDDMKVQGILTERDLVRRLLGERRDQETTALSDIMTTDPRTAREDDDVVECLRLMSNERFRHLPIVDESGRLTNILSQGDFVAYTWPELLLLVRKKATETLRPNMYTLMAILFYTLIVIAMSNIWQDFTFK